MANMAGAPWNLRNDIDRLSESYGYLRRYALDGVDDPSRQSMMAQLEASILSMAESIMRHSQIEQSPRLYFSVLRYERLQSDSSLPQLAERYAQLNDELNLALFADKTPDGKSSKHVELQANFDETCRRSFDLVWVTHPFTADDTEALRRLLRNENIRVELRQQILSAVMLGALEYYDEHRLVLLAETYLDGERSLELTALVALVLTMWVQRSKLEGRNFENVMAAVREHPGWTDDLKMVFMNLVRTRDTERISRTMSEEVIPGLMKMRPEIFKKINEADNLDEFGMPEINPEWEELFESSGVADKLKELNDIQSEGGDVMMGTFAGLKSFKFFNYVSNWFLPFYPEQTEVSSVLDDSANDFGEIIDMAPMVCDSDKYSIVFSLGQMPQANRRMMLEQFKMQNINIAELRNSMLDPERSSRNGEANHFIQDLHRFFSLFRRKSEFGNPFASAINLASVPMLAQDLVDTTALEAVAEFYFKRGYYAEALDIFNLLLAQVSASVSVLQKAGYCNQHLGRIDEALKLYERSELFAPDSLWTQRRIAQCLKMAGRHAEAIPYYEKLAARKPSDTSLALNLGHCYLATGNNVEALKCYFKVEYLDEKSGKALRPIAWCLFVEGDYEHAETYYEKVMESAPSPTDHLNAGHLYMALRRFRDASACYRKYLEANGGDMAKLDAAIEADMAYIRKAGIDPTLLALAVDAAQYPE